jgi:hypothetical protein
LTDPRRSARIGGFILVVLGALSVAFGLWFFLAAEALGEGVPERVGIGRWLGQVMIVAGALLVGLGALAARRARGARFVAACVAVLLGVLALPGVFIPGLGALSAIYAVLATAFLFAAYCLVRSLRGDVR